MSQLPPLSALGDVVREKVTTIIGGLARELKDCGSENIIFFTNRQTKKCISLIFLAARMAIIRSWRSLSILFTLVNTKLSDTLNSKMTLFEKIWDP